MYLEIRSAVFQCHCQCARHHRVLGVQNDPPHGAALLPCKEYDLSPSSYRNRTISAPTIWIVFCAFYCFFNTIAKQGGLRHNNSVKRQHDTLLGRLSKNSCRGEHCSPVPVCLVRKPSRKARCCAKLAGDQWSPLHSLYGKAGVFRHADPFWKGQAL